MKRPQIITLELEDCPEGLVEYVENLERACIYESDLAGQALQSRKELADQLEKLQSKYDQVLQEAKIHSCELDTQKSIVLELCKLFDLRVYDYHCVSKVKEAIIDMKVKAVEYEYRDLLYVVANLYNGDDHNDWSIGANHVFRLFAKEIWKRTEKLNQQIKAIK